MYRLSAVCQCLAGGFREASRRIDPDISAHGFRSTFRDWSGDRTEASDEMQKFCPAHVKIGLEAACRGGTARSAGCCWANGPTISTSSKATMSPRSGARHDVNAFRQMLLDEGRGRRPGENRQRQVDFQGHEQGRSRHSRGRRLWAQQTELGYH
jgi:hypothetical protein